MISQISELIKLQDVDKEIIKTQKKLKEFPKILKEINDKIEKSIQIVEEAKEKLKKNQILRDKLELEVEDLKGKIDKKKSELNSIKTNKEYTAMISEIELLEKKKEEAEEKVIASLLETDEIQEEIKKAEKEIAKVKGVYEKEKEEVLQKQKEVEAYLKELKEKRKKIASEIDEEHLKLYEDLGKTKGGIPLSKVVDGFCSECYMKVRPHVIVELKKGKNIVTCENCGRILYLEVEVKE